MSKVSSVMIPLGTKAPAFALPDVVTGKKVELNDDKESLATVILFICNHCPYVIHINHELVKLANDYLKKHIRFIAINSNDVQQYPDDSPENMQKIAIELRYPFPYLFDETQAVAKAYQAACTPDFYVFNKEHKLVYRGQLDDSRPGNSIEVNGESLRMALDCLLADQPVSSPQKPSMGCNIKWR